MFLDPDDWFEPTMCEKMYSKITGGEYDIVVCNVNTEVAKDMDGKNRGYTNERDYATINTSWCWNKIWKKSILDKFNITFPDGLLGEDACFKNCYYIVSNQKVGIVNEKLCNYLVRKDSLMSAFDTLDNSVVFDCFGIGEFTYQFYKKHGFLEHAYPHYFKSMGLGIKFLTEKNYDRVAKIICESLKTKPDIRIVENGYMAGGKFYESNSLVLGRVRDIILKSCEEKSCCEK